MELTVGQEKFQNAIAETLVEAWENETFKQDLIASPIQAIEKLTGEKLNFNENVKMIVVDQSDSSTFYLNIPSQPNLDDIQLNEEQLELVAGGGIGDFLKKAAAIALLPAVVAYNMVK